MFNVTLLYNVRKYIETSDTAVVVLLFTQTKTHHVEDEPGDDKSPVLVYTATLVVNQ